MSILDDIMSESELRLCDPLPVGEKYKGHLISSIILADDHEYLMFLEEKELVTFAREVKDVLNARRIKNEKEKERLELQEGDLPFDLND